MDPKHDNHGIHIVKGGTPAHHHDQDEGDEMAFLESPIMLERMLRQVYRMAPDRDFADFDEVAQYLERIPPAKMQQAVAQVNSDPHSLAQELAYEAFATDDDAQSVALAQKALELDPECLDAIHVLAERTSASVDEFIETLDDAVRNAERRYDDEYFERPQSEMRRIVETGPYVRLKLHLADLLRVSGRCQEAIGHLELILDRDPEDNHSAAPNLLSCYLIEGELQGARRMLERLKPEGGAVYHWGVTLERYLADELKTAEEALNTAKKQNPHVAKLLESPPDPEKFDSAADGEPGTEGEAMHCMYTVGVAWLNNPDALDWAFPLR